MQALRERVERIVRPVCAGQRTKDRMRAELLAHLEALFARELQRVGDEQTALEGAALQLGNAEELTRELQASVPRWERLALFPLPGSRWAKRRNGESIWRWIFRTTTVGSAASGLAIAAIIVSLAVAQGRLQKLPAVVPFLIAVPILQWWTLVTLFGACERIRQELDVPAGPAAKSGRRARIAGWALFCMASASLAPLVMALMARAAISYRWFTNSEAALACIGWGLLMGLLMLIQLRDWIAAARRYDEWESIELEGPIA